jgi:hypothetical protein
LEVYIDASQTGRQVGRQAGGRSITLVLPLEQVQVDCFTALDLATLLEHPSASFIDIRANLSPISALIE